MVLCSLCNTKATSKQTLLLHADGKKHRAKARAIHASKQQPDGDAETKDPTENKDLGESRYQNFDGSEVQNIDSTLIKKRKVGTAENGGSQNKDGDVGAVTQSNGIEIEVTKILKKAKHSATKEDEEVDTNIEKDFGNKKIKWKKLITSTLKSNPDGALKFKKLLKAAVKSLEESGFTGDNKQVSKVLEQKINSSSRFIVDGKYVRLATSS